MTPSNPTSITADCFPIPALILRTNDPTAQLSFRNFAHHQAKTACELHRTLTDVLGPVRDIDGRITAFTMAFETAEDWRHRIATASPHTVGRYSAGVAERFRTPVTDDNPNLFPIGEHERLRDGATWDPTTRTYCGGVETPASQTMRQIGALATARFTEPSIDVVGNRVTLHDGHAVNGMRLIRGHAAHRAAIEMVTRIAARGGDTSRITTDGHLTYGASAPETDRKAIFDYAMVLLARDHGTPAAAVTAWLRAAYLLYQAPRRKRGIDATIRAFLIAAGTYQLQRPPVLLHDIDLRAYVLRQDQFVSELRAAQSRDEINASL